MPAKTAAIRHNLSRNKTKVIMATKQQTAELVLEALNDIDNIKAKAVKPTKIQEEEFKQLIDFIPERMSYADAITWIQRKQQSEEKVVAVHDSIPCYPLDGAVAVMRAVKDIYGFVSLTDTPAFFGSNPPNLVQVQLADGTFETAVIGRISIPKWESGFLDISVGRGEAVLHLSGQIKKKNEKEVKLVISAVREHLRTSSIYKGQAISIDLTFMHDEDHDFHPVKDSPTFFDVANVDESMLILNDVTEMELAANLFLLIERSEDCLSAGIPLKHGALLMGSYGTGKTLTARILAKKCIRNNWTFIYLKNSSHIAAALRLAKLYAPAVVFSEDTDQALNEGRTEGVNNILNTIDGVDTKDTPIITVLTTNNPDDIEPAFLRPGRIDTVIKFEAPDATTAVKFVERFARNDDEHSLLEPGSDLTEVGVAMAGFVPAFISRAIQKAKQFAMHREGRDILGKVTTNDLIVAAKSMRKQEAMVSRPTTPTKEEKVYNSVQLIGQTINNRD